MSEPRSALNGRVFDGLVRVEEAGVQGMIALRGDLGARPIARAVSKHMGCDMPDRRGARFGEGTGALWMSPDELLLLCPYEEARQRADELAEALSGEHALAVNVSDARAVFRVQGAALRDVIAKLAPVDMAPGAFAPGELRRTRFAQVAAAFWMDDAESARIVCFRSVAEYMFGILCAAADPEAGVGYHSA